MRSSGGGIGEGKGVERREGKGGIEKERRRSGEKTMKNESRWPNWNQSINQRARRHRKHIPR